MTSFLKFLASLLTDRQGIWVIKGIKKRLDRKGEVAIRDNHYAGSKAIVTRISVREGWGVEFI